MLLLFFARMVLNIAALAILVYMFAGWIKAMLGVAFSPIALVVVPLDRGRMLGNVIGFVLGALATYAFSLAVGLIGLNMLTTGAAKVVEAVRAASNNPDAALFGGGAAYSLGFSMMSLMLSVLVLLVVYNAKHWGAEFFGSAAFDMTNRVLTNAMMRAGQSTARATTAAGQAVGRLGAKAAGVAGQAGKGVAGAAARASLGAYGGFKGAAGSGMMGRAKGILLGGKA
ncbi:MAG: hypothetical protein N2690_04870, partial [Rhodocyclaceae bacterium]|nr:hypothetical protein [Rhodocyclaceae bacterium]